MEASDGDTRVVSDIKTRSQKKKLGTVDEDLLKSVDDTDPEVQALVHDQIFFNFVQVNFWIFRFKKKSIIFSICQLLS